MCFFPEEMSVCGRDHAVFSYIYKYRKNIVEIFSVYVPVFSVPVFSVHIFSVHVFMCSVYGLSDRQRCKTVHLLLCKPEFCMYLRQQEFFVRSPCLRLLWFGKVIFWRMYAAGISRA